MIDLKNVTKSYEKNKVIDDLNLHISKKECIALVGKKESGKTTLLRLISGEEPVTTGEIRIDQIRVHIWYRPVIEEKISYINELTQPIPFLNVMQNMMQIACRSNESQETQKEKCKQILTLVQLEPKVYRKYYPYQLSSEEKQKLNVARAWIKNPEVVIFDNPFSLCKQAMRNELQTMLRRLQGEVKKTIVFATEDKEEAVKIADRVYMLQKGKVKMYEGGE